MRSRACKHDALMHVHNLAPSALVVAILINLLQICISTRADVNEKKTRVCLIDQLDLIAGLNRIAELIECAAILWIFAQLNRDRFEANGLIVLIENFDHVFFKAYDNADFCLIDLDEIMKLKLAELIDARRDLRVEANVVRPCFYLNNDEAPCLRRMLATPTYMIRVQVGDDYDLVLVCFHNRARMILVLAAGYANMIAGLEKFAQLAGRKFHRFLKRKRRQPLRRNFSNLQLVVNRQHNDQIFVETLNAADEADELALSDLNNVANNKNVQRVFQLCFRN